MTIERPKWHSRVEQASLNDVPDLKYILLTLNEIQMHKIHEFYI